MPEASPWTPLAAFTLPAALCRRISRQPVLFRPRTAGIRTLLSARFPPAPPPWSTAPIWGLGRTSWLARTGQRHCRRFAGLAYVAGVTNSANFPVTVGAFQTTFNGVQDAFVTKLNAAGNAKVYSTTWEALASTGPTALPSIPAETRMWPAILLRLDSPWSAASNGI